MRPNFIKVLGSAALALSAALAQAATVDVAIPRVEVPSGFPLAPAPTLYSAPQLSGLPYTLSSPLTLAAPAASLTASPSLAVTAAAHAVRIESRSPVPIALAPVIAAPNAPTRQNNAPALEALRKPAPAKENNEENVGAHLFDGSITTPASDPTIAFEHDSPLDAARPRLTPEQMQNVEKTDLALTKAVQKAARKAFKGLPVEIVSRGSSSRKTYVNSNPDYDISVYLPGIEAGDAFNSLMKEKLALFSVALKQAMTPIAKSQHPGSKMNLYFDGAAVTDPSTMLVSKDIFLLRGVGTYESDPAIRVDVSVTSSRSYANGYPEYFKNQLAQVARRDGDAAVERLLADIRLAKAFFKTGLGAYKFYQGGPSAVGIEQLVMQSGQVLDSDQGATILETGSFDKMMARLEAAGFAADGRVNTFEAFQNAWTVHNAFMKPANFLSLLKSSYKSLVASARLYRSASLEKKPLTLKRLGAARTTNTSARKITVRVRELSRRALVKSTLWRLEHNLYSGMRMDAQRHYDGEMTVTLTVPERVDPEEAIKRIEGFFQRHPFVFALESITRNDGGSAPPVTAVVQTPPIASAGALTLGLLDRFTALGPRPSERGDAFLYAQGAKTVAPELEAAWRKQSEKNVKTGADPIRTSLLRRNGRTYILQASLDDQGREKMRPITIPDHLVQGVVSDTLVEVSLEGDYVVSVRPIGAYAQDVMIGRVVKRNGSLVLDGLFREMGRTSSLYSPLPLVGAAAEGAIVQAFVRPGQNGYEASVLIDLGTTLTPEIAAREIALRRGARAYFDEDVILQAESEGRADDPFGAYKKLKKELAGGGGGRIMDLRAKPFITIDPPGAGDLDDAFTIEKHADGSFTWVLATADVAHYVKPGTPAFRAAARIGNTFYSIDKDGVPEYPMNHPVVSKHLASLLDGKDSLAMITRMQFDAQGQFLLDKSEVFLGLIHVQGRYTYDQVSDAWHGESGHGIKHMEQVTLARELSDKLTRHDGKRGKFALTLDQVESAKKDGRWGVYGKVEDPLTSESHRLIEELKVYGNRVIAVRLNGISRDSGVPHISRVHPAQDEAINDRLRRDLKAIGVAWKSGTISEYLTALQAQTDLAPEKKQVAQWLVLTSRKSAGYAVDDAQGHEGLALEASSYDHPSAPIRRFSDMYNRALLEASLAGKDPKAVHDAVLRDLMSLGFASLEDYLRHLNGREQAARQMDYEVADFMSLVELAKPENHGRTFRGYVRLAFGGKFPRVTIQLQGSAATVMLNGPEAAAFKLLDDVEVEVHGVNLDERTADLKVRRLAQARH